MARTKKPKVTTRVKRGPTWQDKIRASILETEEKLARQTDAIGKVAKLLILMRTDFETLKDGLVVERKRLSHLYVVLFGRTRRIRKEARKSASAMFFLGPEAVKTPRTPIEPPPPPQKAIEPEKKEPKSETEDSPLDLG